MNILIVDDEHYMTEYIKFLIDWNKLGFSKVITTNSSLDAKSIIDTTPLDILITDIRMPEISGLDLVKQAYESNHFISVIILSGYSEFSYAKTAMHFGVMDYLVKPIVKKDLEGSIHEILKRRENLLKSEELVGTECLIPDENWKFLRSRDFDVRLEKHKYEKRNTDCHFFWSENNDPNKPNLRVGNKYFYAENIEKKSDIENPREIFFSSTATELPSGISRDFEIELIIRNRDWLNLLFLIEKKTNQTKNERERVQIAIDLYTIFKLFEPNTVKDESLEKFIQLAITDFPTLISNQKVNIQRNVFPKTDQDVIVNYLKKYISENYGKQLSLDFLGELVHLHPVYLSKLFKEVSGSNFTTFLTEARLEKASELLKKSDLRVNDISVLVGYQKTQYFIKLFKNKYGQTPQQYRKKRIFERNNENNE